MLQTACVSPELLVNPNMSESEICGYSPGQGSPLPGETASPKSRFQQSPSLPDSGLTELNVASPKIYHPPPPCAPQGMSAPADSELSSDPPQRRYMGVRVKMPVRELLRKIRLSKGLDPAHGKEASPMKTAAKGSSGKTGLGTPRLVTEPPFPSRIVPARYPKSQTTSLPWSAIHAHAEKRRAHPYTDKQLRQSKQSAGQSPRGLEDLDILVEVLQEDLNGSQPRREPPPPPPRAFWQGCSRDAQSSRWESPGSKEAAGGPQGGHPGPAELLSDSRFRDFQAIPRGEAEGSIRGEHGSIQGCSSPGMFPRTGERGSSWWMQDALPSTQRDFPRNSPCQNTPAHLSPAEMLLEAPDTGGRSRLTPISSTRQDLSALSFFQFQLHREESLLRNIPAEKLLAPDENGSRLLHKAVAQGRRALTFALAQRFASLNKIDEKDAQKRTALHLAAGKNQHLMVSDLISLGANVNEQDGCGKTPLHLCAESGYLRVLEVLKECKSSGVRVEVDLPDHHGFTPLHRAALAHTALLAESRQTAADSHLGRFLALRRDQILEGIHCLLQMGGKPELQVLNSCPSTTTCLKLEENTELMSLLQAHKPQGQDLLRESYSLLDAPRGIPSPPAPDNFPELCSLSSLDLFDVILKGRC